MTYDEMITSLQNEFDIDELNASVVVDYVFIRQSRHIDYRGDPIANAEYYMGVVTLTSLPAQEIASFIEENVQRLSEITTLPERSLMIGVSLLRN